MKSKKLFQSIGNIEDRFIEDAQDIQGEQNINSSRKSYRNLPPVWRVASVLTCAAVLVVTAFTFRHYIPTNSIKTPVATTHAITMDIHLNKMANGIPNRQDKLNLDWKNAIKQTPEEAQAYYGTQLFPQYLPASLSTDLVSQYSGQTFYIWKLDGAVYYDQNCFQYLTPEEKASFDTNGYISDMKKPSVFVNVAKVHNIHFDDVQTATEGMQESHIGTAKVMLYTYEDSDGTHYYAEFDKDGVQFNVTCNNIAEQDFLKILESYLK